MGEYGYLLDIAIILTATKALSIFSRRFSLPPVVGALVAGVILGPVALNIVTLNDTISSLAEIGVIVLMFQAGLETDVEELKKSGLASFIIALMGVVIPLLLGFLVALFFEKNILQDVFVGVLLTATSVSISVETLQEMGKLKTKAGTAILGAAIIDDILGIILLSIITSIGNGGSCSASSLLIILGKIVAFFLLAVGCGYIVFRFFKWIENRSIRNRRRIPVMAFAFCLFLAYFSELFGIADITGAYISGIILCNLSKNKYILSKVETLSYMLITPIFFASIGLKTTVKGMGLNLVFFTLILCVVAIISKIIGCGLGAKIMKYSNREVLQIGIGMISRGEVALIMANKGMEVGLMKNYLFAPIVIMVVLTTLLTPLLLKLAFKKEQAL